MLFNPPQQDMVYQRGKPGVEKELSDVIIEFGFIHKITISPEAIWFTQFHQETE